MRMRSKNFVLTAVLLLGFSYCSSPERELPVTKLSGDLEPLRTAFNNGVGKVRLLLIIDPN